MWQLVRDLNLEAEFVAGDPGAERYILRNGRLHRAPFSPAGLIATRLMGLGSKLRILTEVFGSSRPPANEETLAELVQRKFGAEVLDYLVDPLISTVFFGDAHKMGMQSAFPALVEWERERGSVARDALHARNAKQQAEGEDASLRQAGTNRDRDALRVAEIQGILGTMPNLQIVGNFLQGRSIGDCVDIAFAAAQDLHSRIPSEII